jgi:sporulation and spore germination protein/immunoglobulin-like protein involved in spore germination
MRSRPKNTHALIRGRGTAALLLCLLAAGCGGKSTPHRQAATTTSGASTQPVKVYFLRGNQLVPVTVSVPKTLAVATASLQKLLGGAPSGYRTAIPPGTQLQSVAVSGGHATVRLSAGQLSHSAQGQLVYTLTQFPSVTAVDGGPFAAPASRADFTDLTPQSPIYVAEPQRDASVPSPIRTSGTADVFEGTLAVDVWSGGKKLRTQTIQATSGTGTRGTWSARIAAPPGPTRLVFYEPSAENGEPLHATTVLLTVR